VAWPSSSRTNPRGPDVARFGSQAVNFREPGSPLEWVSDCVIAVVLVLFFALVLPITLIQVSASIEQQTGGM
jgi:hypothetical protein